MSAMTGTNMSGSTSVCIALRWDHYLTYATYSYWCQVGNIKMTVNFGFNALYLLHGPYCHHPVRRHLFSDNDAID